ncbi:MAG: hypothetical protein WBA88_09520 [Pseudaminobacter sp.]
MSIAAAAGDAFDTGFGLAAGLAEALLLTGLAAACFAGFRVAEGLATAEAAFGEVPTAGFEADFALGEGLGVSAGAAGFAFAGEVFLAGLSAFDAATVALPFVLRAAFVTCSSLCCP